MTESLTKLLLNLSDSKKHSINKLLSKHIVDLNEELDMDIKDIHSQYNSLIKQYYKPYHSNTEYGNIVLAMNKAHIKLKYYS